MTHDDEEDWPTRITKAVIAEVTRRRKEIGLTAQELADACEDLGFSVPRNVIANWESGRRRTITIPEILVLAEALMTSPAELVFPLGTSNSVDCLPDHSRDSWDAFTWFIGENQALGPSWKLLLFRKHAQVYERIQHDHAAAYQLQFRYHREEWPPGSDQAFDRLVADTRASLLPIRARMHHHGLVPPTLATHLTFLDQEIPPRNRNPEDDA